MDLRVDRSETDVETRERLQEAILNCVISRTGGRIRELDVSVTDGVARLTGYTSRYYYKQLATSSVQDGDFGLDIENAISVGVR